MNEDCGRCGTFSTFKLQLAIMGKGKEGDKGAAIMLYAAIVF